MALSLKLRVLASHDPTSLLICATAPRVALLRMALPPQMELLGLALLLVPVLFQVPPRVPPRPALPLLRPP